MKCFNNAIMKCFPRIDVKCSLRIEEYTYLYQAMLEIGKALWSKCNYSTVSLKGLGHAVLGNFVLFCQL